MRTPDKIDAKSLLRAYQKIVDEGTRKGDRFVLGELAAQVDFDGYSITVSDREVNVRLLFHNKIAIDSPNSLALERFREKLGAILRMTPTA